MSLELKPVQVRLPEDAYEALRMIAQAGDQDLGEVAREILTEALLGKGHAIKVLADRLSRATTSGRTRNDLRAASKAIEGDVSKEKKFAASKYLLQVREKQWPGVAEDSQYSYWDKRDSAVQCLIDREQTSIAMLESQAKRARTRLNAFIKKERP